MLEEKHFSNEVIAPAVCFILVLKLLDTNNPLTLASQIAGTTGMCHSLFYSCSFGFK